MQVPYMLRGITAAEDRTTLLANFNGLETKDEQDAFLGSSIIVCGIIDEEIDEIRKQMQSEFHDNSHKYHVKIVPDGKVNQTEICLNATLSIFGIKKG
ncbi:hypothetical protein PoB_001632200 [Plakobranchus ocellatus]|uniref:Uncharacterized protein n=1 Tax=Plakobranchus ocellatus TaxID=259542 RepID=A0AAV3Z5L6_9GAST|nr:hypothetical protein PoB_001632200 [Plakobranchus ocellatus]